MSNDITDLNNTFWLNNPSILFRDGNFYKIIPTSNMNQIQILNSLTLFFIYLTIVLLLFPSSRKYFYIPIIAIIIIIVLYYVQYQPTNKIKFTKENFNIDADIDNVNNNDNDQNQKISNDSYPTNNPYGNITMADLIDSDPEYPFKDIDTQSMITDHSQRQFYTTAVTAIANDQTAFAKWLYEVPETCKENPTKCLRYEDVRFSRYNPSIDKMDNMDKIDSQ